MAKGKMPPAFAKYLASKKGLPATPAPAKKPNLPKMPAPPKSYKKK